MSDSKSDSHSHFFQNSLKKAQAPKSQYYFVYAPINVKPAGEAGHGVGI